MMNSRFYRRHLRIYANADLTTTTMTQFQIFRYFSVCTRISHADFPILRPLLSVFLDKLRDRDFFKLSKITKPSLPLPVSAAIDTKYFDKGSFHLS